MLASVVLYVNTWGSYVGSHALDDARTPLAEHERLGRLMLMMLAGVVQNGEGFDGRC